MTRSNKLDEFEFERQAKLARAELWGIDDEKHPAKPCFVILVVDGIVYQAADIARWTEGKPLDFVRAYYQKRGAIVLPLKRGAA